MSRKFRSGGSTQTKLERGKNYKYDNSGNLVENTAGAVADDEFTFTGSKSSLRRIADLERNVSILIAKSQADGASSTVVSGTVTNDDWDSYWDSRDQSETLKGNKYYEDDVQVEGNFRVDGSVDFRDGFSTTTKSTIKDIVGGMVSNNTESGISVTFDSVTRTLDFNVNDPAITLTGDVSGSATMTNLGNVSITTTVANDSHTHAFANITGKPTTLAGYGITDSLASGSHTHAFADLTSKPTTLAGYGITDAAPDTAFVGVSVSNDTLTFTRDDGTTVAVTTSDANTNYYVTGGSFDAATQVLTLTRNSGSATVDLSGLVTSAELTSAINGLTNGAGAAFDTLKEIQDAMATDAELSAAISGLTIGNGTMTIAPGAAMTGGGSFTANQTGNSTVTISHADTSNQASVNNSGRTYIQDVTLDAYGHVTGLVSATETVTNTWRGITDTPTNDSATSISAAWAQSAFVGATVSNDTITFTKGDGTTTSVTTSDANSNTWRGITDTPTNDSATSISAAWAQSAFVGATVSNDTITFTKGDGTTTSVTTSDANSNTYVTGASFNTADGVLTLTRNSGSVTVDLDGRFTDNAYADTMNQHVRTTDSPTFAAVTATNFNGTATYAKYADLAERYAADAPYEEGTLLAFGGEAEVTAAQGYASTKIAGVVSVKPAVAMNAEAGNSQTHPFVALQGRVPVKVVGTVRKGDILVASDISGVATVWKSEDTDPRMTAYVGIAIENKIEGGVGFVEVKVGK